jgi:hypothetical protein
MADIVDRLKAALTDRYRIERGLGQSDHDTALPRPPPLARRRFQERLEMYG